ETVYKEWEDIMERAAITASSLDSEFETAYEIVQESLCEELIDDRSPFWNEIEVNAGNSNLMLLALVTAAELLTTVRHNIVLHNMVAFLEKPAESDGFYEIIDFLNANQIHYALTVNPTIYTPCIEQFWATAKIKSVNGERQLQALVDKKKVIIMETSIWSDLHLEDAGGIDCLLTATIFEELARMGYEKPSQKHTFYKAFFSPQWKFLIHTITQCLSAKTTTCN
ncbi:hypothetical protein Tco_1518610, partial [Tanacetum coccineum]